MGASVSGNLKLFRWDGLSIGIDRCCNLDCDNFDNGVYIIEDWNIVGREYYGDYPEQNEYALYDMLCEIDKAQPKNQKIGEKNIAVMLQKEVFKVAEN